MKSFEQYCYGDQEFDNNIIHIHKVGLKLLHDMKIKDCDWRRLINLAIRPDISGQDFSGKDLSGVYLNGACGAVQTIITITSFRKFFQHKTKGQELGKKERRPQEETTRNEDTRVDSKALLWHCGLLPQIIHL